MIKKYFNKFLRIMEKNKCPECKGSIDSNGLPIEEKVLLIITSLKIIHILI